MFSYHTNVKPDPLVHNLTKGHITFIHEKHRANEPRNTIALISSAKLNKFISILITLSIMHKLNK